MEVELEVVGRHMMLFDDDATSAFVNSKDALIEWNSLFIDRFDVRNLLPNPPSSFRTITTHGAASPDAHLQSELDLERYADLSSSSFESEVDTEVARTDASGYHFVPFSYGNSADSSGQKNLDVAADTSAFNPSFSVPGSLRQNLPPTEKVHQIIARTALFVGEHGCQSEIVLRVKQGDNPAFGFLMPHHHLHPYFRYLVDHLELLKADHDGKSHEAKAADDQTGGALSLLGSAYGTGEDEEGTAVVDREAKPVASGETSVGAVLSRSHQSEQINGLGNVAGKDVVVSKVVLPSKVKVPALSKNRMSSKSVNDSVVKNDANILVSTASITDNKKASSLFPVSKVEKLLVDPPSEVKRLVDRIVEIILKNGKNFEAVLIEQDKRHGKFPFLLPSNQYHPYYLKVLKKAQEYRISGKSFNPEKDGLLLQETDKNTAFRKECSLSSSASEDHDFSLDCDKKEKFKMVIAKSKKDAQDHPSKEGQQKSGITVDAAAAAAILQAATRGIKKPNLDFFTKASVSGPSHGSSNEGGQASSFGSLQSSQHPSSGHKQMENGKSCVTIPVAKEIAKNAALAAAGEADSSEAGMTREQKLRAERLRRAKMFAAMIKGGVAPLGTEPQPASSSVEPHRSQDPGSATEAANQEVKDREGSSVPVETEASIRIETLIRHSSDDELERKATKTRHYRSRKHDDSEEDEHEGKREKYEDDDDDVRHSRKRHRAHESSRHSRDRSKDVRKHRRKHSSRSKESRHRHKHESTSSPEEDDRNNRYKHDSSSDDEHKRHKRRYKHDSSSEDESKYHRRKHKHSRKVEDRHKGRYRKSERRSQKEEVELEEGEIRTKSSDQSSSAIGDDISTEASLDASKSSYQEKAPSLPPPETTEVPDELRAKIRAMLLATM